MHMPTLSPRCTDVPRQRAARVCRMPYFSYISMLHLYETLGWWSIGSDVRKIHFAEVELLMIIIKAWLYGNNTSLRVHAYLSKTPRENHRCAASLSGQYEKTDFTVGLCMWSELFDVPCGRNGTRCTTCASWVSTHLRPNAIVLARVQTAHHQTEGDGERDDERLNRIVGD